MEGKVLALDYGKSRVGVAVGDFSVKMAFPKCVILNKSRIFLLDALSKLVTEVNPVVIVIGLPFHMEAEHRSNAMVSEIEKFVDDLTKILPQEIAVKLLDERLSTFEAEDLIRNSNISSREAKSFSDAVAAQIILNRFFEES